MADPKYANLPGIDLNSPDVFETSDLPESEQDIAIEDESEAVEKLNVDPKEAFSTFSKTSLDSAKVDFSDRVGRQPRTGYTAWTEYELGGTGAETAVSKYQRLQTEIQELADEAQQLQSRVSGGGSGDSSVVLGQQVEQLQKQLADLHLDKLLGPQAAIDLNDPQGALHKQLLQQLESVRTSGAGRDSKGARPQSDQLMYELYYNPQQTHFTHNARVVELEGRLERLEALLGTTPDTLASLTAQTRSKTLLGAVESLSGQTSLLEPDHLDTIEGRLQAVSQRLSIITEKKTAVEETDKLNKVSELYDIVKKWEGVAVGVPDVVERLTALQGLHEQALQFSAGLAHLDTTQQATTTQLQHQQDATKQLESTFKANIDAIKANCENLESRITAIKK